MDSRNQSPVFQRINALRKLMQEKGVDVVIIPTADPHLSEYIPKHYQLREYFSGFTGSAGVLIVAKKSACLFTDSRYLIQAKKQLKDTSIELIQSTRYNVLQCVFWILKKQKKGTLAFDGTLFAVSSGQTLIEKLTQKNWKVITKAKWIGTPWKSRPLLPKNKIYEHSQEWVDLSLKEKLQALRKAMKEQNVSAYFVSKLDEIAWVLNLRGSDIAYNPVFIAYLLITEKDVKLFVDKKKLDQTLQKKLGKESVYLYEYKEVYKHLKKYQGTLLLDSTQVNYSIYNKLHKKIYKVDRRSIIETMKAVRGEKERNHLSATMVDDGIAFCRFWAWLDSEIANGNKTITELDVSLQIEKERRKIKNYKGASFETIAAFNENAALPHYAPTPQNNALINQDGLLLIDTGGQYLSGTTDMTRVIAIGTLTKEQKLDYTRVLKAMISLSMQTFPTGLSGCALDAIARSSLWNELLDYGHGTGHGVGYFLNVHEGPQQISCYATPRPEGVLVPGMVTSIEPGLYRDGAWGIRIENLALCELSKSNAFGKFMQFKTLTCCPIDQNAILVELLTPAEKNWLNAYHEYVYKCLSAKSDKALLAWLKKRTQSVG